MRHVANTIITLSLLTNACGKSDQKVQTVSPKKTDGSTSGDQSVDITNLTDPNCSSSSSCNVLSFTVNDELSRAFTPTDIAPTASGVFDPNTAKAAVVGSPINWTLTAMISTPGAPSGRILLAPFQIPTWVQRTSSSNSSGLRVQTLTGTPAATDAVAGSNLVFIARDMVKCKVTAQSPLTTCVQDTNYNAAYDKYIAVPYIVSGGSGVAPGAYPTAYPYPTGYSAYPTPCVPGQSAGGILGGLAGGLLGGIGSAIGTMVGGKKGC